MMDNLNQKQIKIENSRLILRHISQLKQTNRSELSRITGLSRPTVSSLVEDLIHKNYLCEKGQGLSSGGKRPTLLAINKDAALFLSIDFSDWKIITVSVLNLTGEIVQQFKEKVQANGEAIQSQVIDIIHSLAKTYTTNLKAIIFPVRGILNKDKTEIIEQTQPSLPEHFFTIIGKESPVPIFLERNAHAAAFGEWKLNYSNHQELLYLSLGKGISAGMIINGTLYRGPLFAAGEIAHIPIKANGAPCSCGEKGCLEAELLETTIINSINALKKDHITENDFPSLVENLDSETEIILQELADRTAKAVRILMELLNIPTIILGGRFISFGDLFLQRFQNTLYTTGKSNVVSYFKNDMTIRFPQAGKDITALGAGLLLIDKYLHFDL